MTDADQPTEPTRPSARRFTIAVPQLEDAPVLAKVHVEGWRVAYGHLLVDHERWFGSAALERRTQQWTEWLTPDSAAYRRGTLRAGYEDSGIPVGFATSGPTRDEDGPRALEQASLYIDQAWYGTGLGRALAEAVIGREPASVWVTEDNPRARRFYEKLGFVTDGTSKVEEHLGNLRDIRMVR